MSGHDVAGGVVKVVELVGSSESSFSDAVRNAVKTASRTVRNIQGVDVVSSSATVGEDGELTLYKVDCKVAFLIESSGGSSSSTEADIQQAFE
jgi:dodecin